jgi:hypothetical protein
MAGTSLDPSGLVAESTTDKVIYDMETLMNVTHLPRTVDPLSDHIAIDLQVLPAHQHLLAG